MQFAATGEPRSRARERALGNPWFRMYGEFRGDPKVRTMTDSQQIQLVRLFCLRSDGPTEELSNDELRDGLNVSTDETLHETKTVFLRKGFIDEKWGLLNWGKRQFLSDSSTERVRKYRSKQAREQDETLHETLHETHETQNVTEQNRTEQNRAEQKKPSPRAKKTAQRRVKKKQASPPTKTDFARSRHAEFKVAIFEYWKSKNPEIDCPWAAPEGMQLEMWLRASPNITISQFKDILRNRYRSVINHGDRPSRWIKNITSFATGPIDGFGNPLNGRSNGNGHTPKPPTQYEIARDEQLAERRSLLEKVQ